MKNMTPAAREHLREILHRESPTPNKHIILKMNTASEN
jgi:hypothetical protein